MDRVTGTLSDGAAARGTAPDGAPLPGAEASTGGRAPRPPWWVVVPVKGGPLAKSRFAELTADHRATLARALAEDTLGAVLEWVPPARVLVVTADPATAQWSAALGAGVVDDPGGGLDAAVHTGFAAAHAAGALAVAVLLGDHPCASGRLLAAALTQAGSMLPGPQRAGEPTVAYLPDSDGTGTALLAALGSVPPRTAFGRGSAAAHARLGHRRIDDRERDTLVGGTLDALRLDVDDAASLAAATRLGLRRHTARVVATLGLVQASIHTFDGESGSALLDDGRLVTFAGQAWAASGLRHLRVGQRVSVELVDGEPVASRVWVVGIGHGETIR